MIQALKLDATFCSLGIPDSFDFLPVMLTMGRRRLASSGAAGTADTHEMVAFCREHGIVADVEVTRPGLTPASPEVQSPIPASAG